MRRIRMVSAVLASLAFVSCASVTRIDAKRVDPPGARPDASKPAPVGIVEDSAILNEFALFPESVDRKISEIYHRKQADGAKFHEIQNAVCEGSTPRFTPSYTVHLIPPKLPHGTGLDAASARTGAFVEVARNFIKKTFFTDATKTKDFYGNGWYLAAMKEEGAREQNYKLRDCHVEVPFVGKSDKESLEKLLSSIETARVRDPGNGQRLSTILVPNSRTAILTDGSLPMLFAEWDRYSAKELTTSYTVAGTTRKGFDGSHSYFYTPSTYGWETKEKGVIYPLHLSAMTDLMVLKENFTFHLPKKLICQMLYPEKHDGTANLVNCDKVEDETGMFQHWGYDFHSGKFSPSEAVASQDNLWQHILANQTSLKEAAQEDGSIQFEVSLDLGAFCAYGVPVSDLVSQ